MELEYHTRWYCTSYSSITDVGNSFLAKYSLQKVQYLYAMQHVFIKFAGWYGFLLFDTVSSSWEGLLLYIYSPALRRSDRTFECPRLPIFLYRWDYFQRDNHTGEVTTGVH